MNTIAQYIVTKAQAAGGLGSTGNGAITESGLSIENFTFLKPFGATTGFADILGRIIGLTLTIASIVAFFYLLFAGFQYITAGGDAAKATTARNGIANALIGIIVIIISYTILHYVGTGLLGNNTNG